MIPNNKSIDESMLDSRSFFAVPASFLGRPRPRERGWHIQHFVQFVPAVHLSQTGFLCFEEHARDSDIFELAMDDMTKL